MACYQVQRTYDIARIATCDCLYDELNDIQH